MNLSDLSHIDTCAGRHCNTLELRANMHRIEGRRGWFCDHCWMKNRPTVVVDTDYEGFPL